ncbi:hypothetical protein QA584_22465 [Anaerocolumna sp. AGMB13025]|uniref:DUF6731 family protein n=1 Tax=Anaerocolumna sp. AGMB13025 TaxID=3039116 RepID=UPI00241E4806|nr:DUF6731 family protein [Anaerocolumna sp. AGMB13025]WFR56352.1 hypothetical protein QA584_22465 [Anaerocolumna sp. AGMB13025]
MVIKRSTIKYQYYEICCMDNDEHTDINYDFRTWIAKLAAITDLSNRIKDINGIKGRVENIDLVHNEEYYAVNFMRMDELSNTYLVREDEEAEHIDLEDGEYIGKNTVILYDPRLYIVMVQCNRGGYGVTAIESYINSFNSESDLCYLRPILSELDVQKCLEGATTKIDVRFSDIREFRPDQSEEFEEIVDSFKKMECITAHIEIGMGQGRNKENKLDPETVYNAVTDIIKNKRCISSAKIMLTDDQKSAVFDLFNNIESDKITFPIQARGELGYGFMADTMAEKYDERARARILNILRRGE